MNQTINKIVSRRSIRLWRKQNVPGEVEEILAKCALSAPSSHDSDPFEVIIVDDKEIISDLLEDRLQLKEYPYWINSKEWAIVNGLEKYQKVSRPPLLIVIAGNKDACPDESGLTSSLASSAQNVLIAAESLKLGAVWLYINDKDMPETEIEVKKILGIPEEMLVLCMIAVGYSAEEKKQAKIINQRKIHKNEW